jgi:hypothetical protein
MSERVNITARSCRSTNAWRIADDFDPEVEQR